MTRWVHKKRILCLACCFGSVLLLSGCSWMYTELELDDMRRAEIRARGIELENMKREETPIGGDPFNQPVDPPLGRVEPGME